MLRLALVSWKMLVQGVRIAVAVKINLQSTKFLNKPGQLQFYVQVLYTQVKVEISELHPVTGEELCPLRKFTLVSTIIFVYVDRRSITEILIVLE